MNESRAVKGRANDHSAQSPKRKKVRRQKYAPKACVSCRRSKLKCSGENPPCQRCIDSGKRCFYSEDQTAAEALQTLSRPPIASPALSRGAEDAPLSMEARMARIEALMQAVLHDRASSLPADEGPLDGLNSICLGARPLAFPIPAEYQRYCTLFFADLNVLYPCLDEAEFRASSAHMLAAPTIPPTDTDTCLLALHYIIFACVDIIQDATSPAAGEPPGWQWFHLADELVGKRPQYGCGEVSLFQCLLFQALYFTFAEQPSRAYSTIGMASRLVLQYGLHRQSSYTSLTATETRDRLRTFWNVYIADRRISLSCCRPYSIRESDVDVEWPMALHGQEPYLDSTSRNADVDCAFIACMIHWSHLAGSAWDRFSAATALHSTPDHQSVAVFDTHVTQYTQSTISKLAERIWPDPRAQHVYMSLNDLRLLVARPTMFELELAPATAHICSRAVTDTLSHASFIVQGATPSCMRHAASALASALLALCALLANALSVADTPASMEHHTKDFRQVLAALTDMAPGLPLAQRILEDFARIINLIERVIGARERYEDDPGDAAVMLPHNILDLFPYRGLNPAAGLAWGVSDSLGRGLGLDWDEGRSRVLWF